MFTLETNKWKSKKAKTKNKTNPETLTEKLNYCTTAHSVVITFQRASQIKSRLCFCSLLCCAHPSLDILMLIVLTVYWIGVNISGCPSSHNDGRQHVDEHRWKTNKSLWADLRTHEHTHTLLHSFCSVCELDCMVLWSIYTLRSDKAKYIVRLLRFRVKLWSSG